MNNPVYAIGIMSGTSVDGIDAVLLRINPNDSSEIVTTHSQAFTDKTRKDILALMTPGDNEIDRAGRMHRELGLLYAQAALALLSEPGAPPANEIIAIGSHGQTVRHRPDETPPFTVQLGCGATIAQQTGITTVTDFRSADVAVGGQGAPFAPFFHYAVFSEISRFRAIVNLGGIANITLLDGNNRDRVIGFDSGPANGLMDAWIYKHQGSSYDQDGAWAKSGKLHRELLNHMLDEPYLARAYPKSTGRERFNLAWIEEKCRATNADIAAEDVQHTLGVFTAESIARQLPKTVKEVYICGGGASNGWLMQQLSEACHAPVETTDALGVSAQWIEASAFAWFAHATLQGKTSTIPSVTGASKSVVTGAIYIA